MKYAHIGINLLLISTIPNFAVHAESPSLIHLDLPPEFVKSSPFIQKLFTEDNLLSYDALIELIEAIENDTLGPCTPEDMQQISELIANLARQGLMPDASEMEKAELEVDLQKCSLPILLQRPTIGLAIKVIPFFLPFIITMGDCGSLQGLVS